MNMSNITPVNSNDVFDCEQTSSTANFIFVDGKAHIDIDIETIVKDTRSLQLMLHRCMWAANSAEMDVRCMEPDEIERHLKILEEQIKPNKFTPTESE